jgi:hypothetical protein
MNGKQRKGSLMRISDQDFKTLLARLRKMDAKLWIGICAEVHDQYNEMPFWVLVKNREQIPDAIGYLQGELLLFQNLYDNDVTVSFGMRTRTSELLSGVMKGALFFDEGYAISYCMDNPLGEIPRHWGIFDMYYPDEWSQSYAGKW